MDFKKCSVCLWFNEGDKDRGTCCRGDKGVDVPADGYCEGYTEKIDGAREDLLRIMKFKLSVPEGGDICNRKYWKRPKATRRKRK